MIQVGRSVLFYDFRYDFFSTPVLLEHPDGRRPSPVKAVTHCVISLGVEAGGAILAHGEAYCSTRDNFSRRVGRELSIRRAVSTLSRAERGAVLDAYFNRHLAVGVRRGA